MKLFEKKPKKIPSKLNKVLYDTYLWGYNTREAGELPLDVESFKERLNKGFVKGMNKKVKQ